MTWTFWAAIVVVIATVYALIKRYETRLVLLTSGSRCDGPYPLLPGLIGTHWYEKYSRIRSQSSRSRYRNL